MVCWSWESMRVSFQRHYFHGVFTGDEILTTKFQEQTVFALKKSVADAMGSGSPSWRSSSLELGVYVSKDR